MGIEECIKNGLRCSKYLGLFDCLIAHFWFHEYELTVEFIVNGNGLLDSIIIEGPVFYKPGDYKMNESLVPSRGGDKRLNNSLF